MLGLAPPRCRSQLRRLRHRSQRAGRRARMVFILQYEGLHDGRWHMLAMNQPILSRARHHSLNRAGGQILN